MRILIVGGASALARALLPALSEIAEVITAGRSGCDVHLDLSDHAESMVLPDNIDVVINAAGSFGGNSFEEMLQAENVNVLGVLKLCHSCVQAHIKQLVLISSILAHLDGNSHFYGIYSLSKKHSDEVAHLYCTRFGLPLTILRPSQFYGVGESQRKHQPFLSAIIDKAAKGEDIAIYGSHDAKRNYIHVEDIAKILVRVIQRRIEGTYDCMNPENVNYTQVAAAAIEAFGSRSTVKFMREKADIPDNIFEPDDTLYRLIDYHPHINISAGMKKEAASRKLVT